MPTFLDPDSFGFLIADISRLMRGELDRRIGEAGLGLTPGESRTLSHAARAGIVRQNVLAERMGVEAMTLSAYLDRLEAHGLVERMPDPADRRANLVRLTDAADAVLASTGAISAAVRAEASASIAPEDWARLTTLLKVARDNLAALRCAAGKGSGEDAA